MGMGIPLEQQEAVTILVAQTVVTIMSDPRFFNHLIPVQRLQAENAALRQHIMLTGVPAKAPQTRKRPPAKKPAKRVVKKSPSVQVRGSQFRRGLGGQ